MESFEELSFPSAVYSAVKRIPKGKTASYGQIAAICGKPRASRIVGRILHNNPEPSEIPCHRVVFKDGSLSSAFAFGGENVHRTMLENEGVKFNENGKVKDECFI